MSASVLPEMFFVNNSREFDEEKAFSSELLMCCCLQQSCLQQVNGLFKHSDVIVAAVAQYCAACGNRVKSNVNLCLSAYAFINTVR